MGLKMVVSMALNVKNFLTQYYMQLHMNNMPVEVRAAWVAADKNNQLTKEMKTWRDGTPADQLAGTPEIPPLMPADRDAWANTMLNNDLPDPTIPGGHAELSADEWDKLFLIFQSTLRGMAANVKDFANNDKAKAFLSEYFGDGKLFNVGSISKSTNDAADKFANFLAANDYEMGLRIHNALVAQKSAQFDSIADFKQFVNDVKAGKHKTDVKVRSKLEQLAQIVSGNWEFFENNRVDFTKAPGLTSDDVDQIANNLDEDNRIDSFKLLQFKREYGDMLKTLYKEDKVLGEFSKYDKDKVSGPLKAAREKINYDNKESDNYLFPKRDDELNLAQLISKHVGETFEENLKKFTSLRGDRMFVSPDTKLIVKAFDKSEIKPTDGLGKVLDKVEDIKKNLAPVARKKFEYFVTIMGELKATMPKAFAGALNNGRQLRALVSEMIISAVKNGKVEEAKVAMEVLSVIKYGYTTSKIMDALRKEKFTMFSDSSLSWNKGAGVKFVTTALDKSIRAAFLGVGYTVTITNNTIQRNRSKFNGDTGRIGDEMHNWQTGHDQKLLSLEHKQAQTTSDRDRRQGYLDHLNTRDGINATNIAQKETNLARLNGLRDRAKIEFDSATSNLNAANQNITNLKNNIDTRTAAGKERGALKREIKAINKEIVDLQDIITNAPTDPTYLALDDAGKIGFMSSIMTDIRELQKEGQKKQDELQTKLDARMSITDLLNERNQLHDLENNIPSLQSAINIKQNRYNDLDDTARRRGQKISYFHAATKSINELNEQITNQQNALDNWDDKDRNLYRDLMAHWDFLESGATKSHAFGKTSTKQKKFMAAHDSDAMKLIYNNYQYAA